MKRFCGFVIEHISIAKPGITTFEVKGFWRQQGISISQNTRIVESKHTSGFFQTLHFYRNSCIEFDLYPIVFLSLFRCVSEQKSKC